jgi:hypothetical protein
MAIATIDLLGFASVHLAFDTTDGGLVDLHVLGQAITPRRTIATP